MKKLFTQIKNERRSNVFLFVELMLVFVVLWFIVDAVYVTAQVYCQPMGFNIENTYVIQAGRLSEKSKAFHPELTTRDDMEALKMIVDRLKRRPDVEAVCLSQNCIPYSNGTNGLSLTFQSEDSVVIDVVERWSTPDYYKVFLFKNLDGSGSDGLVKALTPQTLIASVDMTDRYPNAAFHGKELLGKSVYLNGRTDFSKRIAALSEPARYDHFTPAGKSREGVFAGIFLTDEELYAFGQVEYIELSVRVRQGADVGFVERLMDDADKLYQVGNVYLVGADSIENVREALEIDNENELRTQVVILFFLLLNIFLGVIGTFWFRTQHRRSEVALHMALGASRQDVFLRLISEGMVLLTLAAIPAIVVALNIGYAELVEVSRLPFTALRFVTTVLLTSVLIGGMIVLGIWYPALQAMRVEPAEALRAE